MRTLTATLAGFDQDKASRFRGLVLRQLLRASRRAADPGLLHLFLLPPESGSTRFAIYETPQSVRLDLSIALAIQAAVDELHDAGSDPRGIEAAGSLWQRIDPERRALYLGTGARFAGPEVAGTTIARLVDRTALCFSLAEDGGTNAVHCTEPYCLDDETRPAGEIPATVGPPFLLVDTMVQYLH
ncbi:MAG TPA: hypothetical protein VHC18_21245 [Amycolatopsis sp.]|nr:hypothetical protein [Amycolatopsis sp.]